MSKRLDKKKLKRQTTAIESPIAETSASKETFLVNIRIRIICKQKLSPESKSLVS